MGNVECLVLQVKEVIGYERLLTNMSLGQLNLLLNVVCEDETSRLGLHHRGEREGGEHRCSS